MEERSRLRQRQGRRGEGRRMMEDGKNGEERVKRRRRKINMKSLLNLLEVPQESSPPAYKISEEAEVEDIPDLSAVGDHESRGIGPIERTDF